MLMGFSGFFSSFLFSPQLHVNISVVIFMKCLMHSTFCNVKDAFGIEMCILGQ